MPKRLVDIDNKKLDTVQALLGTKTLKATVDAALDEIIALNKRRKDLIEAHAAEMADFQNSDERSAAWG